MQPTVIARYLDVMQHRYSERLLHSHCSAGSDLPSSCFGIGAGSGREEWARPIRTRPLYTRGCRCLLEQREKSWVILNVLWRECVDDRPSVRLSRAECWRQRRRRSRRSDDDQPPRVWVTLGHEGLTFLRFCLLAASEGGREGGRPGDHWHEKQREMQL